MKHSVSDRIVECERDGITFWISARPTLEGYIAWWGCPECGQTGSSFTEVSLIRAQRLAQEAIAQHSCEL